MSHPTLFDDTNGGMYLVQDIITDCSVVASLSSAAAYEYKHNLQVSFPTLIPIINYVFSDRYV
jgi:hypothetical protein